MTDADNNLTAANPAIPDETGNAPANPAGNTENNAPAGLGATPGIWLVKAYAGIYALLFAAYFIYCLTAYQELKPVTRFIDIAFPSLKPESPDGYAGIPMAGISGSLDEEHGHMRFWQEVSFNGAHGVRYEIPAGARITTHEAEALARAIIRDEAGHKASLARIMSENIPQAEKDEKLQALDSQRIVKQILIYKPGRFIPWPLIMTLYNIGGLFLLLGVFLRLPISNYLDQNAAATRRALERTRKAEAEAEELKARYQKMLNELKAERRSMDENLVVELAEEKQNIIDSARQEAQAMLAHLRETLDSEVKTAARDLRAAVADEAITKARTIITGRNLEQTHQAAVTTFINDIVSAEKR